MRTVQRFISTGSAVLVAIVGSGATFLGTTVPAAASLPVAPAVPTQTRAAGPPAIFGVGNHNIPERLAILGHQDAQPPATGTRTGQLGASQIDQSEHQLGTHLALSREYGQWNHRIPVTPDHTPVLSMNTGPVRWAAVASGNQDAEIRRQAAQVKAINRIVYLAFQHEPEHDPNGTPAEYIAAWHHYVNVFAAAGVRNVRWTWIVTANGFYSDKALPYYPGDSIVQVVGADGYNWAGSHGSTRYRTFEQVFAGEHVFAVAHGKPMIVAEFGMVAGPNRAQWLEEDTATLRSWPNVAAELYWNQAEFAITSNAVGPLRAMNAAAH